MSARIDAALRLLTVADKQAQKVVGHARDAKSIIETVSDSTERARRVPEALNEGLESSKRAVAAVNGAYTGAGSCSLGTASAR